MWNPQSSQQTQIVEWEQTLNPTSRTTTKAEMNIHINQQNNLHGGP